MELTSNPVLMLAVPPALLVLWVTLTIISPRMLAFDKWLAEKVFGDDGR